MSTSKNIEEMTNNLYHVEKKLKSIEEIHEELNTLETNLKFLNNHNFHEGNIVDVYKDMIIVLKKENELLLGNQDNTLLKDIKCLLDLNQRYIKKVNEQFSEIENLRANIAKTTFVGNNQKFQELKEQLANTKEELRERNKKVRELHENIHIQRVKQNEILLDMQEKEKDVDELKRELINTQNKLQQKEKDVDELQGKLINTQNKLQKYRELNKKEQKVLKLYNTPRKYFLESKKWYVRPLGIFFRA